MISLKNENLVEIVEYKLDKLENEFTEEELGKITDVVYDLLTIDNEIIEDDLSDLKYFKNLKSLYLMNAIIGKEESKNIFSLPSLRKLTFDSITFKYTDFVPELRVNKIAFINTSIDNFEFLSKMKDIEEIEIVSPDVINLDIFTDLKNLKNLSLKNCIIGNIDLFKEMNYLEIIGLDNTNVMEIDFLEEFENLKIVSLNRKQIENNKETIKNLKEKNVKVFVEDCVEY